METVTRSRTTAETSHDTTQSANPRRTLQRAANAQWPYTKATNRPIRAEFGLPKTRSFRVQ
jgi:hypothetical protein